MHKLKDIDFCKYPKVFIDVFKLYESNLIIANPPCLFDFMLTRFMTDSVSLHYTETKSESETGHTYWRNT